MPSRNSSPKLPGTSITINPRLISDITGIPLTNGKAFLFADTKPQPSKADIMAPMAVLNPGADPEWETSKNKIPIGYV
ncbi:hypothetical protein FH972_011038 [Carpinus fangiana]|uniref:Uncharacterized protein n=1 Tax=Carpinus fangiana TaxID=176857 RepID=A0A660KT32_9ROSI|nr:hypothetical protein FH972_011038 [Carpinus fangiana]